jgi:signal transduction histidine kinase
MLRHNTPRLIFISAIILLLISGIATGWTIRKLYQSEQWVHHTFEVELTLGSIESDLAKVGRSRTMFVNSGDPHFLDDFSQGRAAVLADVTQLRDMISDNADQVERCSRLEAAINGRLGAVEKGIELAKADRSDKVAQADITANVVEWAVQTSAISDEMNHSEEILLQRRARISGRLFILIISALLFTFLLAVFLIWEHYRRLAGELQKRTVAEQRAQNLSIQVLQAQDEERRRISRELHDGLGQNLTAAKMIADSFANQSPNGEAVSELTSILGDSVASIRSISYLLYPPLLDEIGLPSAAGWFIEGLCKRTGIAVNFEITGAKRRLNRSVELTLFRILQESLTNIQRHARASSAEVLLGFETDSVALRIRDAGIGISAEKLEEIEERVAYAGLGLAGMKQRAQEQGGTFRLSSNSHGTTIDVELPARFDASIRDGMSV